MQINKTDRVGDFNTDKTVGADENLKDSIKPSQPQAPAQPQASSLSVSTFEHALKRRRSMKGGFLRDQLMSRLDSQKSKKVSASGVDRLAAVSKTGANAAAAPAKRSVTFVYDVGAHRDLTNLQLKGSWNKTTGQFDPQWGGGDAVAMKNIGDGKWSVTVDLLDDGQPKNWEWGVVADGPAGKGQWAVMSEGNLKFNLNEKTKKVSYSPTTYDEMGAHKTGKNDVSFKFWAPNAQHVTVKVFDESGRTRLIPMKKDAEGNWTAKASGGWSKMEGKGYVYQIVDSQGKSIEKPDPYARVMQGEQRGIDRTYIDLKTGKETNQFYMDPEIYNRYKDQIEGADPELAESARQTARNLSRAELVRFEVEDEENVDSAYLVFKDDSGRQLSRTELINRLGRFDSSLIDKLHGGKYNDLWSNNIDDKGRIKLVNEGGTLTALVNNLEKMTGLHYEMQVYERNAQGKLVLRGDKNLDNKLSAGERKATAFNDRWSDEITAESGKSFRASVIAGEDFGWQNDGAKREKDPDKWVIYQLHVGSFFGKEENANRSTFEDLINNLDYFKDLGVNTLEMLPANEFEGDRDWGYMGVNSFAIESAYGFEDEKGKWISGAEALKRFIDAAHARGFNVINDVVYNHVGGDYNVLWNIDGKENPYFNWSKDPSKFEKRDTQWGAMPAYNNPKVRQFFVDHAVAQLDEFHFDGLRFDFTEPIKASWGGGEDGRNMLREINRQLHFLKPDAFIAAEQFDYDPDITRPVKSDGTGVGFDAQWYTEFQHRLVRDNTNPGIIQQAAMGMKTDMDQFMNMLVSPRGLDEWSKAVTVISNHDEVGNAQRTIDTADGDSTTMIPPQWARNASRFAAGIGLSSPGVPMFFQGDESMAENTFKWGVPSTWDAGWDWELIGKDWDWNSIVFNDQQRRLYDKLLEMPQTEREKDAGYKNLSAADRQVFNYLAALPSAEREQAALNITRHQTYQFYKEALALRSSSPAFEADAAVSRVYTHNDNSVMAFTRKDGGEEFLIVGSLNRNNLEGYNMPLPPGQWKEVFDSDAARFGGSNFGNYGATINGGPSRVNIPAGGYVVFKKV